MSNLKLIRENPLADHFRRELNLRDQQFNLLISMYCDEADPNYLKPKELIQYLAYCVTYGLDPMRKEAVPVKFKERLTIVTTIGGLRAKADETGCYAPSDKKALIEYTEATETNPLGILSATMWVKKFVQNTWHEVASTAFWHDYGRPHVEKAINKKKNNPKAYQAKDNWLDMSFVMLTKCAEAGAIRRAFPKFSNLYDRDEFNDENFVDAANLLQEREFTNVKVVAPVSFEVNGNFYTAEKLHLFLEKQLQEIHDSAELATYDRMIANNKAELYKFMKAHPDRASAITYVKENVVKSLKNMENSNEKK